MNGGNQDLLDETGADIKHDLTCLRVSGQQRDKLSAHQACNVWFNVAHVIKCFFNDKRSASAAAGKGRSIGEHIERGSTTVGSNGRVTTSSFFRKLRSVQAFTVSIRP